MIKMSANTKINKRDTPRCVYFAVGATDKCSPLPRGTGRRSTPSRARSAIENVVVAGEALQARRDCTCGSPRVLVELVRGRRGVSGHLCCGCTFSSAHLVTPTMRLYHPRVRARLRGIAAWWFCHKRGNLHKIPCTE